MRERRTPTNSRDDAWNAGTTLKSPRPEEDYRFGPSVAVSDDGELVVVAEPGEAGITGGVAREPAGFWSDRIRCGAHALSRMKRSTHALGAGARGGPRSTSTYERTSEVENRRGARSPC